MPGLSLHEQGETMGTTVRRLVLVKHAETLLLPEVIPSRWRLTEAGVAQCVPLAERLRPLGLDVLVTSAEDKAVETGHLVGRQLRIPVEAALDLHEHDRSNVRLVAREQFEEHMRAFFDRPSELVYGMESADDTHDRFRNAVERVCRENAGRSVGIVSHGTVIALLVGRASGLGEFDLFRRLATPSYVVVDPVTFRAEEVVSPAV